MKTETRLADLLELSCRGIVSLFVFAYERTQHVREWAEAIRGELQQGRRRARRASCR
jgi:hypothetical protein